MEAPAVSADAPLLLQPAQLARHALPRLKVSARRHLEPPSRKARHETTRRLERRQLAPPERQGPEVVVLRPQAQQALLVAERWQRRRLASPLNCAAHSVQQIRNDLHRKTRLAEVQLAQEFPLVFLRARSPSALEAERKLSRAPARLPGSRVQCRPPGKRDNLPAPVIFRSAGRHRICT